MDLGLFLGFLEIYMPILRRMLKANTTLECPIKQAFGILTAAEAPVDVLFTLIRVRNQPDFNDVVVEALLYGKELKGEQR